jgi:GntR family transcriptional regulator, transcriptional repressor for pyruvate dehydrogenase complex
VAHAATAVFERLATAIARGEHVAGSALPSERTLSADLGVSRATIRQAVHRLADLGLVQLKPGGATIVLDPRDATDLRVIGLLYQLGERRDPQLLRDVREKQFLQGFALIDVAARRARPEQLDQIRDDIEAWALGDDPRAAFDAMEEAFWSALARVGGNRIYILEIGWWYRMLREHPSLRYVPTTPIELLVAFYREVARRLCEGDHAARYYHEVVSSLLATS